MNRSQPIKPEYSPAKQALALVLSFATLASPLTTAANAAPLASATRARHLHLLPAAIPPSPPPSPSPVLPVPAPPDGEEEARKWGEITIAQPKIWQYERVNSLLDGLLRDVEGISTSDLTALDPNATNGAAVKFVQSMLEIGVKYDQAAAVTNSIALQNFAASQGVASAQIEANKAYLQQLYAQRTGTTNQLATAMQLNTTLEGQLASTDPTTAAYASLTTQQKAAASQVTSLQADLSSINSQISAASTTTMPAAPSLTSTTPNAAPESANTFSSFLGNLPSGLTNNIVSQLQSPSLPATKRMDNFIALLYERLAREISVLQDDVMRDTENIPFLVQFDVGLYPSGRSKNRVGVVEFTMKCHGCKVYSIYPGQSSYNLANYEGTSKRYSLYGALQTLFGFGINADYRRQTDTLHGDLVQSVYMSGFQDSGAPIYDRSGRSKDDKNSPVTQRFGWYYGASPFETLVTPGIRSTFAILSIPRSLVKACLKDPPEDKPSPSNGPESKHHPEAEPATSFPCGIGIYLTKPDGLEDPEERESPSVMLDVTAHADWVPRDNPRSSWWSFSDPDGTGPHGITRDLKVALPGTDAIKIVPDVVFQERERLHVLGMEYNPVYYVPPPKPAAGAPPVAATPPPGSATATATGNGAGSTTVIVSGAGTASASTSGTASTTATATAAGPASTTPDKSSPAALEPLTLCKQSQCAAILMRFAESLDPNLVVTVNGLPLQRVRDWRGRGTSILPPAQSASDVSSSTSAVPGSAASTTLPGRENSTSAALLEADLPGPDTWMEVDSHRILINVSRDTFGDNTEFPTIQILDPARRALFIPLELDTGISELTTNGFHFPTRNGEQLATYLSNHLRRERVPEIARAQDRQSFHPAGPYAYETFLPLFLPRPPAQRIFAFLGETGVQILIGFDHTESPADTKSKEERWLAGRTQVVLEDRFLDLAWSLSCYPQGSLLVCDFPRQQIRDAYAVVDKICWPTNHAERVACPSISDQGNNFPYISTLQVWVEQYDPEGEFAFRSQIPARLGQFPVSAANDPAVDAADVGFKPWHFESASQDEVTVRGCNYPEFPGVIKILGRDIPDGYRVQELHHDVEQRCQSFDIPTLALTYSEIVIAYPSPRPPPTNTVPEDPCAPTTGGRQSCVPDSLSAPEFEPEFRSPIAIPHFSAVAGNSSTIDQWTLDIPVARVDCDDSLNLPGVFTKFNATWKIGTKAVPVRDMTEALTEHKPGDPVPTRCYDRLASALETAKDIAATANKAYDTAKTNAETAKNAAATAKAKAEANAAKAKDAANAPPPAPPDASKPTPDAAAPKVPAPAAAPKADAAPAAKAKEAANAPQPPPPGASKPTPAAAAPKAPAPAAAPKANAALAASLDADAKAKADVSAQTKAVADTAKAAADAAKARVASIQAILKKYVDVPEWDEASRTGQIILELVVKRSDLRDFPLIQKIQVLRGRLLSSVGRLPELGPSILPTSLTVVNVGTNQFTLQGANAGAIDAVTVQGPDGTISTILTVSGAQIAIVTITDSKTPAKQTTPGNPAISAFSEDSVPGGTMIEIQGSNFGTEPGTVSFGSMAADVASNCWSASAITVDVPLNATARALTLTVETQVSGKSVKATKKFIVAGKPLSRVEPLTCPAASPAAQTGGTGGASPAGAKAGAYSIVPLIALAKDAGGKVLEYMPLDVTDPTGKPLSFTVAEQKAASTTPKGVDSPTTTLTISKKTTVTPAASTSSTAPSQ